MHLFDADGREYLDFIGGWGVTALGHSHPAITKALVKQGKTLVNASPGFYNTLQIEFAELLVKNSCMEKIFFASTGAEANEGAIKLARKYGAVKRNGAFEIITAKNGFHGRTLATMSATGKEQWKSLFEPKVPGFIHVEYNKIDEVAHAITDKTAAVMIEPIQGEGGVITGSAEYLTGLRKLCTEKGVALIFDEVQTGCGRTGKLFAYQHFNVEPDIMTLAKGIGGGYPIAALLAKSHFCLFEAGEQGGTYTGQPLGMAVGLAVINEIIDKDLCGHAARMGKYIKKLLLASEKDKKITNIRGMGLMIGFDLVNRTGGDVVSDALSKGLIINAPRPNSIRLLPPLIVKRKDADRMIEILAPLL